MVPFGSSRRREGHRAGAIARLAATLACLLIGRSPALAHLPIDEQIADLTARIAVHPADASLYLRRGELHRIHGDRGEAMADCERSRRMDPALAAAELCLARTLLDAGEAGQSLGHLDRFLKARPTSVEGWMTRGRAQSRLGRHLEAAGDFTRALAQCEVGHRLPEPDYYLERARELAAAGAEHVDEAVRGLDEGVQLLGPIVSLQLPAIDFELESGRYDAPLARLDTSAAQAPRKEGWLARRATILEKAGRPAEARAACAEALAAIAALPPSRRSVAAIRELEQSLNATLSRLTTRSEDSSGGGS